MMFVDTHAHLPMLTHSPVEEILARATAAGVTKMMTVATEEANWESTKQLAESRDNLWYTLGVHPHDAKNWAEARPKLEAYFANGVPKKCVAIGEMGLDFHYNFSDREPQIQAFEDQLALAKRLGLPVVIHSRNAFPDLFASIKKIGSAKRPGVMHCFTGTLAEAQESIALGFKISFSGIISFKTAADLRVVAKTIPLSEILIETDCPYLAPIPHRGKPNEPSYLPLTAKVIAEARGVSVGEIAEATSRNAVDYFGL